MKKTFLLLIVTTILNYQLCFCMEDMDSDETSNHSQIFHLCCGTDKVFHDGPSCCCCYPDCRKVYMGEAIAWRDVTVEDGKDSCCKNFFCDSRNPHFNCNNCNRHFYNPQINNCCPYCSSSNITIDGYAYYPAWWRCKGCCCNGKRFAKGCHRHLCCSYALVVDPARSRYTRKCILNKKYEGPNLLFCLTCGCCCGACCLDNHGHIIPCAGTATCFADRFPCCKGDVNENHGYGAIDSFSEKEWSCRDMFCCHSSKHQYFSNQYNICSNLPVVCCAALVAAKMGCGFDPVGMGTLSSRVQSMIPKPQNF